MKARSSLLWILAAELGLAAFYYGSQIPISDQDDVLDFVVTMSSVVFGVVGIWLAVVFPEVISSLYKEVSVEKKDELRKKAKRILLPMVISTIVAVFSVFLKLFLSILKSVVPNDSGLFRGVIFVLLVYESIALCCSLVLAAAPGLQILFDASANIRSSKRVQRFLNKK